LRVRKAFKDLGICNAIDLEEWQVRGGRTWQDIGGILRIREGSVQLGGLLRVCDGFRGAWENADDFSRATFSSILCMRICDIY
jgi:hypothetical protein